MDCFYDKGKEESCDKRYDIYKILGIKGKIKII